MVENSINILMSEFPYIEKEVIQLVFENEANQDYAVA